MNADVLSELLAELPALLESLDPAERPRAGLQIVSADAPFEPNPLVSTLVGGSAGPERWSLTLEILRGGLRDDQTVWLLRPAATPRRTTLDALRRDEPPAAGTALFIPAVVAETAERSLQGLRGLVHRLRAPGGCPWDREQTHESLIRFVLEEAYEVVDAIRQGGPADLAEELGDLLLQVFLQAELAEEAGHFSLNDVVAGISRKLVRRHPHVFGDASASSGEPVVVANAAEVERNWDRLKGAEKRERTSALDGMPRSLPALMAAQEVQRRLKKAGFDWPDRRGVEAKLDEELDELRRASGAAATAELGDVLFILARLGLDLGGDAEEALRDTVGRVTTRFRYVEDQLRQRGATVAETPLDELLALWDAAKAAEVR